MQQKGLDFTKQNYSLVDHGNRWLQAGGPLRCARGGPFPSSTVSSFLSLKALIAFPAFLLLSLLTSQPTFTCLYDLWFAPTPRQPLFGKTMGQLCSKKPERTCEGHLVSCCIPFPTICPISFWQLWYPHFSPLPLSFSLLFI